MCCCEGAGAGAFDLFAAEEAGFVRWDSRWGGFAHRTRWSVDAFVSWCWSDLRKLDRLGVMLVESVDIAVAILDQGEGSSWSIKYSREMFSI